MNKEKIPVGMSAGGDNMHYVFCEQLGQQKAYAACLHINARHKEGTLHEELYSDCANAIRRGNCEAIGMRQKEIEAGEALFYRPRQKVSIPVVKIDKSSLSYAKGWNRVSGTKTEDLPEGGHRVVVPKSPAAPKNDGGIQIQEMDYSKVVEQMAQEERSAVEAGKPVVTAQQKKVETVHQREKSVLGGSLLDIAKQQRGAR